MIRSSLVAIQLPLLKGAKGGGDFRVGSVGDIFHLVGGCRVTVFCVLCRIFDRLRRYNNRSCQKVEIAKRMSYDIIIKL